MTGDLERSLATSNVWVGGIEIYSVALDVGRNFHSKKYLEAIFTSVAAPSNVKVETFNGNKGRCTKGELFEIERCQALQVRCRLGS